MLLFQKVVNVAFAEKLTLVLRAGRKPVSVTYLVVSNNRLYARIDRYYVELVPW